MKYRFLAPTATPDADAPARKATGWVVLAVFVLVAVAAAANWARGPQGAPQHVAGPVQALVTLPEPALPDFYQCGDGFAAYLVELNDSDRAVIESMVEGSIQLPWKVTGCDGLTIDELARREGGQP